MMLGNFLLAVAMFACVFALASYFLSLRGNYLLVGWARRSYYLLAGSVVLALMVLFYLFLTHRYDVAYVASYSSSDLPWYYEFSALWAGQQGTFLLWLFWSAILGLILLRTVSKDYESWVMTFYLGIQVFFLTILLKKSPFAASIQTPTDGQGLNPLLQDYWMTIHPPIIFLGFALIAIPAVYAMAALASRKYAGWVDEARPWNGVALGILGSGIILGGYWAYKTLGWGGYWGWDPVENASLMPWLVSIALMHGMILEKNKGALKRTNFILAISAFLLVLYGTFLTRSGVLADFSVHSFVDLGINAFLVLFLGAFTLGAILLLLWRANDGKGESVGRNLLAKEFSVFLSMVFLIALAIVVLLGTSAPLLTRLWGKPANVEVVYYIRTSLPVGIVIAIVLSIVPYLLWRSSTRFADLIKRGISGLIGGGLFVGISLLAEFDSPLYLLFAFFAAFALISNVLVFYRAARVRISAAGGHLTHVGVACMLLGLIMSNVYSSSQKITVSRGESKEAFGYQFTYEGLAGPIEETDNAVNVAVKRGDRQFQATPKFYYSAFNRDFMRKPYIKRSLLSDLYISPLAHSVMDKQGTSGNTLQLKEGESKESFGFKLTFSNFEILEHGEQGRIRVAAVLEVSGYGQRKICKPEFILEPQGKHELKPDTLPGGGLIYLAAPRPDTREVLLGFEGVEKLSSATADYVVLDISRKPLINLLWIGTTLVGLGALLSAYRWRKNKKPETLLQVRQVQPSSEDIPAAVAR